MALRAVGIGAMAAMEDGRDVEEGFDALARGVFRGGGGGGRGRRAYRSKARRDRHREAMADAAAREGFALEEDPAEKSRLLCERILRLGANQRGGSLGQRPEAREKRPRAPPAVRHLTVR